MKRVFKKVIQVAAAAMSCMVIGTMGVPVIASAAPSTAGYIWPLQSKGTFTQGYKGVNHTGVDIAIGYGSNVVSMMDGRVKYVQKWNGSKYDMQSYGNLVIIYHPSKGTSTYYAHLSSINVSNGQYVSAGQVIGKVGSTGASKGNHLHFELHLNAKSALNTYGKSDGQRTNPLNYVSSNNIGTGPAPAPSNKMALSGATYPTTLQKGKPYPVKGTITSPSKITYVSAAVYSTSGKWETGGSTNPNSYSYNLAGLDNKVIYNNLGTGTHVYKVYAKNSSGQVCLLSKLFTVTSGYKAPYASGANAPTSIKCGKFFGLKGMVYGNGSNLQQVTAAVYTTNGTWKTGRTINVNTGSVDIAKSLDPYVVFNHLPRGTYYYKVIAKNAAGTYTLVNKQFKVY